MDDCVDAEGMFAAYAQCAAALDEWHAGGGRGRGRRDGCAGWSPRPRAGASGARAPALPHPARPRRPAAGAEADRRLLGHRRPPRNERTARVPPGRSWG